MRTRVMAVVGLGLMLAASPALAQIEVTPMLGWTYGGNFRDAWYGNTTNPITNLDAVDKAHYGAAVNFSLSMTSQLELLYLRQDTKLRYQSRLSNPEPPPELPLSINYFHGGFLFQQPYGDWRPYGVFHLGAALFAPKEGNLGSEWRFSWALGLGVKRPLSERMGLRLQARWIGNYITSNPGNWCDPVSGFCYGYNSDIVMWQGELTGGVIFVFGN